LVGRVLVTGGAGFIGSHVVDALVDRGESVVIVDNFDSYYDPKRKWANISRHTGSVGVYQGNVEDKMFMRDLFRREGIDRVVHLAAKAGVRPSIEDPVGYKVVNIDGTLNLLEMARMFEVKNFVFASSSSVYGNSRNVPFDEEQNVDRPISPYAATKKAGELLCHTYSNLYGLHVTCLRYFTVYGPRGRPDMAPFKFVDAVVNGREIQLYGDGSSQRDYTYVSDIVEGTLSALENPHQYEIINLGRGEVVVLKDFVSTIEEVVGKSAIVRHVDPVPGDVDMTFADVSKARSLLSYDPKVSLREGLESFFQWYKVSVVI